MGKLVDVISAWSAAIVVAAGLPGLPVFAVQADLDAGFGDAGIVRHSTWLETHANIGHTIEGGVSVAALQPDGKIILAGAGGDFLSGVWNPELIVSRFLSDGSIDATFGDQGRVFLALGYYSLPSAIEVLPDGKVVVAGTASMFSRNYTGFVLRLHANGYLDRSFNDCGWSFGPSGLESGFRGMSISSDGEILVGGVIEDSGQHLLVRYLPDGSLDPSFGQGGIAAHNVAGTVGGVPFASDGGGIMALVVQDSGRILAMANTELDLDGFVLSAFQADGSLDRSFGTEGFTVVRDTYYNACESTGEHVLDYGPGACAHALALNSDESIIVATGQVQVTGSDFGVWRFNRDGQLDAGFGTAGRAVVDFLGGHDFPYAIVPLAGGRSVVVGIAEDPADVSYRFAAVKLDSAGQLDASFGSAGTLVLPLNYPSGGDYATAALMQSDGRMIIAGHSDSSSGRHFLMTRHEEDGSLDPTFGASGLSKIAPANTEERLIAAEEQPDGKIVALGEFDSRSPPPVLARYAADGSLDSSFGVNGVLSLAHLGDLDPQLGALFMQEDGAILLPGRNLQGAVVYRLLPDGAMDSGFGNGGVVDSLPGQWVVSVGQQPDRRLIVTTSLPTSLTRLQPDGSLDPAFGVAGTVSIPTVDGPSLVLSDGRIVVVADSSKQLYRYTKDGDLDSSFGVGGVASLSHRLESTYSVFVVELADGGFLLAGDKPTISGDDYAWFVERYLPDGGLDADFGVSGVVEVPPTVAPDHRFDFFAGIVEAGDGRIFLGGIFEPTESDNPPHTGFIALDAAGRVDSAFGVDGVLHVIRLDTYDQIFDVFRQSDGKPVGVGSSNGDFFLARLAVGSECTAGCNANCIIDCNGDGICEVDDGTPKIFLEPSSSAHLLFTTHTAVATVYDNACNPVTGRPVSFEVVSGPNAGASGACAPNGDCTTSASGTVTFSYSGVGGTGVDQVIAILPNDSGPPTSAPARIVWARLNTGGRIVRFPGRQIRFPLSRPGPEVDAVRCVGTDDPNQPAFENVPFIQFDADTIDVDLVLGDPPGEYLCCEYKSSFDGLLGHACERLVVAGEPRAAPALSIVALFCLVVALGAVARIRIIRTGGRSDSES